MSDASISPADPVFWLHHANLDRLWWFGITALRAITRTRHRRADLTVDLYEADTRNIISLGINMRSRNHHSSFVN